MLDILNRYLLDSAPIEMYDMIEAAHKSFDRVNLADYQDAYIDILMAEDQVALGDTLTGIINLTLELQRQVLGEQGITLKPEATISMHTVFINGILDLFDYSDKVMVADTVEQNKDPIEIFAELIDLVSILTADELMVELESVDQFCISTIKESFTNTEIVIDEEDRANKKKLIGEFKFFCGYSHEKNLDTMKLVLAGLDIGLPFRTYIDIVGRDLETKSIEKIACELIAMSIISCDGNENPLPVITKNIDDYISNVDTVTKVIVLATELMLKLNRI